MENETFFRWGMRSTVWRPFRTTNTKLMKKMLNFPPKQSNATMIKGKYFPYEISKAVCAFLILGIIIDKNLH